MSNDDVLCSMPEDTKFFYYSGVPIGYSPTTGICCKASSDGRWKLATPGTGYGYTQLKVGDKTLRLHRIVAEIFLNAGQPLRREQQVDHIKSVDGSHAQDKLSNLRICSQSENQRNQQLRWNNVSRYKGVSLIKRNRKWQASIKISDKNKNLGYFTTPEAAAEAYDKAALQHYGEFACTNEKLGNLSRVNLARA